jgi:hypothetical protein
METGEWRIENGDWRLDNLAGAAGFSLGVGFYSTIRQFNDAAVS